MNTKFKLIAICPLLAAICFSARAQGTAFTYQGRLNDGAIPVSGIYDLRFALFDTQTTGTGTQQGILLTNIATAVTNGLFTVTLDFGNQFPGAPRWLEIAVRSNGVATFNTLAPRQPLTPTPYATFANSASNLSGTLPATQLTGTVPNAQLSASVSLLGPSIDSSEITDGTIATNDLSSNVLNGTFWKLGGNTGANPTNGIFLGTTDNLPLEFKVNNQRGLRLEYANPSINVIGGASANSVSNGVAGATIAGGGDNIGGGNKVVNNYGTVGGGIGNTASGLAALVAGGSGNSANGFAATVSGGDVNSAGASAATVSGGSGNTATGAAAMIGGGEFNTASGLFTTVGGGKFNTASGFYATIPGGFNNTAIGFAATVGGGNSNNASGFYATIPGGDNNNASGDYSFSAGHRAKANQQGAFVWADSTDADFASTGNNQFLIRATGGVAIGTNDPAGAALRVAGSIKADSYLGMGGTLMIGTTDNQPLEFKVNGQRGLRLEYADHGGSQSINLVGGYSGNFVSNGLVGATIAGGGNAGYTNQVTGNFGTIGGGQGNLAGELGTVGGGVHNVATGYVATVSGGGNNLATGYSATVSGGLGNVAGGTVAMVPGGDGNFAADYAFAAGHQAKATNQGAFVWADSQNAPFSSTANNQFLIRASGGVAIGTNDPAGAALRVAGSIKAESYLGMGATLTFGTTDNQPLEFKVNGARGLRLEYANDGGLQGVNVIGGSSNLVSGGVVGGTIAGGGALGYINQVTDDFGTVGGGVINTASGVAATVAGGDNNTASGDYATIGGGFFNIASGYNATIGGGYNNIASGQYATIPGGVGNTASNDFSFAAGTSAKANHSGTFVWADSVGGFFGPAFASTGTNQFLIRASGGVGIGTASPSAPLDVLGKMQVNASGTIESPGSKDSYRGMIETSYNGTDDRYGIAQGPAGVLALYTAGFYSGSSIQFGLATNANGFSPLMTLSHTGNLGIGTSSPSSRLHIKQSVDGTGFSDSTGGIRLERAGSTAYWQIENWSDNDLSFRHSSGAAFFYMSDTAGTISIASDRNLKKDIEPLAPMLDRVLALKPVSFRYKPVAETEPATLGFVAQDVEQVLPSLVGQKGEYKVLNLDGLIPVSVAAIQELDAKQRELRAEKDQQIGELKSKNAELKARLDKLEQLLAPKLAGGAR